MINYKISVLDRSLCLGVSTEVKTKLAPSQPNPSHPLPIQFHPIPSHLQMALMQQFETTQTSLSTQASLESSATVGNNCSWEEQSIFKDPYPGSLGNNNELAHGGTSLGHTWLDQPYVSQIIESSQYDVFNLQS